MRHAAVFSHLSLASTAAMLSSLLSVANMAATSSRLGTPPVTLGLKLKRFAQPYRGKEQGNV
jgi:hypothetical protein